MALKKSLAHLRYRRGPGQMTQLAHPLRSRLGLPAVAAIVVGDMLGSGIFFAPGELAGTAREHWQVYFVWALAGFITLCGALSLAELSVLMPKAGASYHFICEGFGPFWGFMLVWINLWVSGPGSIAGIAVSIGEFLHAGRWNLPGLSPVAWGSAAILFFVLVNLAGVEWGGRTQVVLTLVKVSGIAGLVIGGLWLATEAPTAAAAISTTVRGPSEGMGGFLHFIGVGIAAVLFTYDGWIDVSNLAGEVRRPERNIPWGLGLGVTILTLLYLVVNLAYLRAVPIEAIRQAPTTVADKVAIAAFGPHGGTLLSALVMLSMFGAMGGLIMTIPRLYYTMAAEYRASGYGPPWIFRALGGISSTTAVPWGAILFTGAASIGALVFFGSFSKLVNFLVVPTQMASILTVTAIFRLRPRRSAATYRTPGYPVTPLIYIVVLLGLLLSAIIYQPVETLIGLGLSATGVPVYFWLRSKKP